MEHESLTEFHGSPEDIEFAELARRLRQDKAAWLLSPEMSTVLAQNTLKRVRERNAHRD